MAEIASGPAGEVTKAAISSVEAACKRLFHFRKNIEEVKEKVEKLTLRKHQIIRRMDSATRNGERCLEAVEKWLDKVEIVEVDANILTGKAARIDKKYKGWGHRRFSLSRKARDQIARMEELLAEEKEFGDSVSHPKRVQDHGLAGFFFPIGDYQDFASRKPVFNQILQALRDDNISLVGVSGVKGVGKTMFMKALANHVKGRIFKDVAMVNLGQKPQVREIQGDVANQLDLEFKKGDIALSRAQLLSRRLMTSWKTLIILDDVRERVELDAVGIPYIEGRKNCKIVFTATDEDVFKHMDTQMIMNIGVLSAEESWELFQRKAGHPANSPSQALPGELLRCCNGIPSEIVAVARSVHGESESILKYN